MKKILKVLIAITLLLYGCSNKTGRIIEKADLSKLNEGPQIVHKDASFQKLENKEKIISLDDLEQYNNSDTGLDIRTVDLSALDLRDTDLTNSTYDTQTEWPDKLPDSFNPKEILETGKNSGLGIRALHNQGITGEGVNVAIIDGNLFVDHVEYKERIQLYEKNNSYNEITSMHGPAVTSILGGKSTGVAPKANIYYISESFSDCESDGNHCITNLNHMVESINRVIEINESLPENQKIKVLSISRGYSLDEDQEVYEAIENAKTKGIFVVTPSLEYNYGIGLLFGKKEYNSDPDNVLSYSLPNTNPTSSDFNNEVKTLIVPAYHRTTAGPYGTDDYIHFAYGSASWVVPWLAGMYALCLQVNPELSGEKFLEYAMSTGNKMDLSFLYEQIDNSNTVLINPEKLIEKVRANRN